MCSWHWPMMREPPMVPPPKKSAPYRAGTATTVGPHHGDTDGPADDAARRARPGAALTKHRSS